MQIENYPVDFVQRTLDLMNHLEEPAKQAGLEVSLMMNCLLGLIVATCENHSGECRLRAFNRSCKQSRLDQYLPQRIMHMRPGNLRPGDERITKCLLDDDSGNPFDEIEQDRIIESRDKASDLSLYDLLGKIRHGIAHQNIRPVNSNSRWSGIVVWNIKNRQVDFVFEFNVDEVRELGRVLAEKFVAENKKLDNARRNAIKSR